MSSTISGNVTDDMGSVAAMRVALQTLAERCERLQFRLDIVEKENASIKSQCQCKTVNIQTAQIDVKELSCKKQQLVEYLRIVTDENCKLWTKLSSLDNPAFHSNDTIKPKNSLAIIDNYLKYNGMHHIIKSLYLLNYISHNYYNLD